MNTRFTPNALFTGFDALRRFFEASGLPSGAVQVQLVAGDAMTADRLPRAFRLAMEETCTGSALEVEAAGFTEGQIYGVPFVIAHGGDVEAVIAALTTALGEQHGCNSGRCACWGAAEVLRCRMGVTLDDLAKAALEALRQLRDQSETPTPT